MLDLRDNVNGNRATREVSALRVDSGECSDYGSSLEGHEKYQTDCLEAEVSIWSGLTENIGGKVIDS